MSVIPTADGGRCDREGDGDESAAKAVSALASAAWSYEMKARQIFESGTWVQLIGSVHETHAPLLPHLRLHAVLGFELRQEFVRLEHLAQHIDLALH